ncbi:peptidyl-prolyl cis-trans isomerase [Erythrobacter sp. SD-21]|uniref:peptidyl-prolyl cis-trans isomerase n=1 Tax=Erythrobacter sp. SD-21 TaxID=161528 RepID=UPI000153FCE4|nr:peptidyl-prolyl cis-trans isomerase [Erythrobacter sp. SD-21]EDL50354.1 peptidyl-prolyl isomerase [Erythrobacter sp. SD-21]
MLTFFRNFFKTKIGLAIALAFLGLIGFAFASMDVSNTGAFGGVAGGDSVAVVGGSKISTAELNEAMDNALRRAREENPDVTMQTLIAEGEMDRVLEGLIDRYALMAWAEENGFRAGANLVNSEIRQIPAARGPSGNFETAAYEAFLRNNSITDSQLRQQLRTTVYFQQAVFPALYGTQLPESIARTYARSFKERRSGGIATIPAALFAPQGDPTDAQLSEFYAENRSRFVRPERRTLRYATFDSSALGGSINPSDEDIAAYYQDNAEEYAARETRNLTQLIVPTREGAEALAARVRGGESFAQAASSSGLRTTQLDGRERSDIRSAASQAVADAYFSASEGAVTAPARSSLGWHIARVNSVDPQPARSLAEVRDSIVEVLREQKRQRGIAELAVGIEDRLADGASLSSVASELGVELQDTPPLTDSGLIYGTGERVPDMLAPVLEFAFQIDEGEPEIGALADQQTFLIYEVADITPSAAAPLAEIRNEVTAEWRRVRGNEGAEEAANRVLRRVEEGATLAEAVAAEEKAIGAPQQVTYSREELARMGNTRVPAPIALLFGMAKGTAKKLEGSRDLGWYVVDLEDIVLEDLEDNDPLIGQAKSQIAQAWGNEYGEQLIAAMRSKLGVERNEEAIAAVRRQLLGETN